MTDQAKAFLKWDVEREEGYLELPDHPDFRLTPARPEDDEDMVKMYNDPTVYRFMDRALSTSYHKPDAEKTYNAQLANSRLQNTLIYDLWVDQNQPNIITPTPFQNPINAFTKIRQASTGRMIADLTFVPYVEYNLSIIEKSIANAPPSEQIWVARYALIPGWEGKGLMGAAMKAIWWWTEEVNRIAGLCGYTNTVVLRSVKLLEALGYTECWQKPVRPPSKVGEEKRIAVMYEKRTRFCTLPPRVKEE